MSERERICLVIPYYEAGDDLTTTLGSVRLRADDLIVVVDDGSRRLPARDVAPREAGRTPVELVELERHGGITAALRTGASRAPEEFGLLGRLDCGDTCRPDRFDKQRRYLEVHPSVVLVGSWVDFVAPDGSFLYRLEQPAGPESVRRRMRINCAPIRPPFSGAASTSRSAVTPPDTRLPRTSPSSCGSSSGGRGRTSRRRSCAAARETAGSPRADDASSWRRGAAS